jgi:hypothetical protein
MALAPTARYLLRPLAGPPLLFIAVVSVLLAAAATAGLMGLPLQVLLAAWIWAYAYLLVDYTARGLPPPVFAIEMVNPWHEPRPLLQLIVLLAAASLAGWLAQHGARPAAVAVALVTIASFPASLAVLAIEGDLARAVWPPALIAIARGLGLRYLVVCAIAVGSGCLVIAAAPHVPSVVAYALGQLAAFSVATSLGGALYERRDELGFEAWESPERRAASSEAIAARARDRLVDEVYALLRAREGVAAWDRLHAVLDKPPASPDTYRWFRDRAARWEDRRIADRLNGELVARLLALGRRGEALLEVEAWWRQGGEFHAVTQRDLDVLKSAAAELGRDATRQRLLLAHASGEPGEAKKPAAGPG